MSFGCPRETLLSFRVLKGLAGDPNFLTTGARSFYRPLIFKIWMRLYLAGVECVRTSSQTGCLTSKY
jgi:hypothetical protein